MKQLKYIIIICLISVLSSCDNFESTFYEHIDNGQINAIKNGSDTFDLSTATDFAWDSVVLIRGNESVPVFKEEIEQILNNKTGNKYKAEDLPTNRDRFYFLTPKKNLIIKEISSGIHIHKPAFDLKSCMIDSTKERFWLLRKECKFILKTNVQIAGEGTVFMFPNCETKFTPKDIKYIKDITENKN